MEKFEILSGVAAPLMRDNVDTDAIIPAEWMRSVSVDYAAALFGQWRYDRDGNQESDFVLNDARFRRACILLSGRNFGCGSSRENAIWALLGYGIRCVIAPSFSDIFRENCTRNGLLALCLERSKIEKMAQFLVNAERETEMSVDLVTQRLRSPDGNLMSFEIEPKLRDFLLAGMDAIDLTLKHADRIDDFQKNDLVARPWAYPNPPRAE